MLNEGTTTQTAEQIAEAMDYYGSYVDYNCGMNKSELSLISLNKYANNTISILGDMLANSTIPQKELDVYLRNKRQQYLVQKEKTGYIARKEFTKLLFGDKHPYADVISAADYENVNRDELLQFYANHINAGNCRIMVSGNVDDTILQQLHQHFGSLPATPLVAQAPHRDINPAAPGHYNIHKPDAVQTSIRIGKLGLILTDPDYARFQLLNTILGGYFGSRLMSNIREEKGYTYGINSFNVSMPLCGYWGIATDVNAQYAEATISEVQKEITKLQTELVGEDELQLVKNFLHGELLRELDGVFSQSDTLKHKLNYGLDNNIYHNIIEQISTCTPAQLMELANKYLNLDQMYYVTVG
ncbi:MAG: M16 family metallopeptidase [Marinifilaceae bacterium]